MSQKIILVGGGGHCKVCIDIIRQEGKYEIAGIIDRKEKLGRKILHHHVIATDDDLPVLTKEYRFFLITLGLIRISSKRELMFNKLKSFGVDFPVILSPVALVSRYAAVGEGTIVMNGVIVNPEANIGKNCIINSAAVIEHDSTIYDHCHISTGSIINGGSVVGSGSFIGSNAVVSNNIRIAEHTLIGAGSVVIKDIDESGMYAGNPARRLE